MRRCANLGTPRTFPTRTFCTWPFEQRRISATSLMVRMFDVFSMCASTLHASTAANRDAGCIRSRCHTRNRGRSRDRRRSAFWERWVITLWLAAQDGCQEEPFTDPRFDILGGAPSQRGPDLWKRWFPRQTRGGFGGVRRHLGGESSAI